ncbi:glycosyltransferase family 4 protein [Clostridium perfringens]|uniref:glycosyltransferase family 4 protein n=1 Tax=Clostridium perfringens TaxID=1502 RepID=UPI000E186E25|nr:glycosyltransferase family 4 protein [Clostridium perfringens]WFB45251.1 glycosyltransferase family 4 protein [Clostridium perfringens]WFD76820.1 glycosyltransferase family 4 protein [Clostridium perfringens]WFD85368.1 glycosyltransferase family 4 protein [Clostridium perfringens]WFD98185.1 glycosyltransferase family 4 protein [Clostridium perfringens]SUY20970.1 glycosyltransferase [Clostridium perfringens]
MNNKKILYVRSGPYELNFNSYNLQEIGLGTAFCKVGYDFDLIYYSKRNKDQIIEVGDNRIKILWRKGIKLLRTGIYPQILNKKFLSTYDIVLVSEYSQLMTVLISRLHKNTYLYNGPYYNMFKIPFIEKIYDFLFVKYINKNILKIFNKTERAEKFIANKGISNSEVVGVGLDITKFTNEKYVKELTQNLLEKMKNKRNILYVGSIIKRKNVELIIRAFNEIKKYKQYKDVQLILIGKGEKKYIDSCISLLSKETKSSVIHEPFIENAQLKFIYEKSEIFLLPSLQEIFGMVLLEAMYFGVPTISSNSAGAETLISNEENGIIISEFDEDIWKEKICFLLDNESMRKKIGDKARETIINNFMWDSIVKKMKNHIK